MHNEAQIILQQVFNKRSLNDVSISELKALTEQYPYFNAAQFLLAKKIRQEKAEAASVKHPSLFFHNPLWFNFLMKQELVNTEEIVEDELVLDPQQLAVETEMEVREEQGNGGEQLEANKGNHPSENADTQKEKGEGRNLSHEDLGAENLDPEKSVLENLNFENSVGENKNFENSGSENINFENTDAENINTQKSQEENLNPENSQDENFGSENLVAEKVAAEKNLTQGSAKDESLEFEPFHTIDYFASQGIKLRQADLSKDKFGQQLKSFTDWLKSMKKIPAPSPDDTGDPVVQEQVIQFAQVSNETKEIITETMAEVWSLQGNRQKAIDIYKKLSLLNPAKSAYFASKIDKLNS